MRCFSRADNLSNTPNGLELGLQYAQEAVALDPSYGLGQAALADAYVARTFMGLEPVVEGFARARAAAERSVELDDVRAYPRLMMGFVKHHGEWDWDGALQEFERAVELEPDSADASPGHGRHLHTHGENGRRTRDPVWPRGGGSSGPNLATFARASAVIGDMDRAYAALNRAYDAHSAGLLWFPRRADNDVFRTDPRYDEFLRRMNFVE